MLVREARNLLHTLEHLKNRKGNRYSKALYMAERRLNRRRGIKEWDRY